MKKYSISLLNLYTKVFHLCFEHENNLDFFSLKVLLKNGPTPASFSFIFGLSNKHYKFLQQIYVKKCPSSIWCWDSNPRPSGHESPPITTRPGLPPSLILQQFILTMCKKIFYSSNLIKNYCETNFLSTGFTSGVEFHSQFRLSILSRGLGSPTKFVWQGILYFYLINSFIEQIRQPL